MERLPKRGAVFLVCTIVAYENIIRGINNKQSRIVASCKHTAYEKLIRGCVMISKRIFCTVFAFAIFFSNTVFSSAIAPYESESYVWVLKEALSRREGAYIDKNQEFRDITVKTNLFQDNFEKGISKWDALEAGNGQTGSIVSDPLNNKNKVFRAYTWQGNNPKLRPRSELRVDLNEEIGEDYWYLWKFMVDPKSSHNSASEIIGQWHTKPDFAAGEDWDNWKDGSFAIALELDSQTGELLFSGTHMRVVGLKTGIFIKKGKWQTILWHIKHSTGGDGYVEAWVDGKSLLPYNGSDHKIYGKTAYNSSGSYLKLGSYRFNYTSWEKRDTLASGESIIYYDNVAAGRYVYSRGTLKGLDGLDPVNGNETMLGNILMWLNMPHPARVY